MNNSLENPVSFILKHPLFCLLNESEAQDLIHRFRAETVESDQFIALEGEPITKLYLVISGKAEVIRIARRLEKKQLIRITVLEAGDTIGLTAEGFSSHTGLNTTSVKALSPMQVLTISLSEFLAFLRQPQITYPNLKRLCEEFLIIQFIRSQGLFDHLTYEQIMLMIKETPTVKRSTGTYLYQAGDIIDAYYYLLAGEVRMVPETNESTAVVPLKQIVGLSQGMPNQPSTESALVTQDAELLVIAKASVKEKSAHAPYSLLQKIVSRYF